MSDITQICSISGQPFIITESDQAFYEMMGMPLPEISPVERQKNRMRFRNFRALYNRQSDMSGKSIISMYDANVPCPIYTPEEWYSDNWNEIDYGRDFDFDRPFFEQWAELRNAVPKAAFQQYQSENCEYDNLVFKSKNCYLVFGCVENEDCMFGHIVWQSKDVLDSLYVYRSELCYESIDCVGCYMTLFSQECTHCSNVYFSYDLRNCQNCFGCTGLRNKQYCWFNEQITRREYEAKLSEVLPLSHTTIHWAKQQMIERMKIAIHPEYFGTNNESVSGNHVYFSKNTHYSFDAKECEDCKYIFTGQYYKDSYDVTFSPGRGERLYECLATGGTNAQSNFFCIDCMDCVDIYYSDFCNNSQNCFACSGLRRKQYCILNKQYNKQTYEEMKTRIIEHMKSTGEWGRFFPAELSLFAYNESVTNEYYPLKKEQALQRGYRWKDDEEKGFYDGPKITIPNTIREVANDITQKVLICEVTSKPYKITSQEFVFYKKMGIPIPKKCPDERHMEKMRMRNTRALSKRNCSACQKVITTSFFPNSRAKVYCEKCYLNEVQ